MIISNKIFCHFLREGWAPLAIFESTWHLEDQFWKKKCCLTAFYSVFFASPNAWKSQVKIKTHSPKKKKALSATFNYVSCPWKFHLSKPHPENNWFDATIGSNLPQLTCFFQWENFWKGREKNLCTLETCFYVRMTRSFPFSFPALNHSGIARNFHAKPFMMVLCIIKRFHKATDKMISFVVKARGKFLIFFFLSVLYLMVCFEYVYQATSAIKAINVRSW